MPDLNKQNDWFLEVNWNPKDKKINDCKIVRVTFPDGKEALIEREKLHAVLFAIGRADEQRELVPQTQTRVMKFKKLLKVKAFKNMEKGEELIFPYEFEVPIAQIETIGKAPKQHVIGSNEKLIK
ncbi:hypothetical protein M0R04_10920 [Candidatus Dojkabacteria bacterium]|jgi:hypothetical protein|nr:hypothetical protein [Candidatus Dojkabacteria bacterium]